MPRQPALPQRLKQALQAHVEFRQLTTPDDAQAATDALLYVKRERRSRLQKLRDAKQKAHAAWKAICAVFNEADAPFATAEDTLRAMLEDYEQRRLNAAPPPPSPIDELPRWTPPTFGLPMESSIDPTMPPPALDGVRFRETWTYRITDWPGFVRAVAAGQAPLGLVVPNATAMNHYARTWRDTRPVPGVEFYAMRRATVGTGSDQPA